MQYGLDMRTVMCNTCTLVYTDPPPRRNLYQRFYFEAYADYYDRVAICAPGLDGGRIPERIQWQLQRIEIVRPLRTSRLLEIGPGKGAFLWWAKDRGADVIGLEPSPEFVRSLRSAALEVVEGSLDTCDLVTLDKFDIIVMLHVFEHFYEPNTALQKVRHLLRGGGLIVIEVPNILKPFRSLDRYFLRYVHPFQYSPETLRWILEKHGFEVVTSDEGEKDWRTPQSIFLIAKLRDHPKSTSILTGNVERILAALLAYRRRWALYGAVRWHLWRRAVSIRSITFRIARRVLSKRRRRV
jgi:SAM-dependent methyltransferase